MDHQEDFTNQEELSDNREKQSPSNQEGTALLKKNATNVFLALFLYTFVPLSVIYGLQFILYYTMGSEAFLALTEEIWFSWGIGVGVSYLIGVPIVWFFAKKIPAAAKNTHSLSLTGFLFFIAVGWGAMMCGSLLGNGINGVISNLLGREIVNETSELISKTPIWLIFIIVVIIVPIVEENIYRRFLIDRISAFGEGFAVFVSATAFALYHGNLYQFFYAFGVGLILAYLYVRTGKMRYNILLHMTINFLGSVLSVPVSRASERISSLGGDLSNLDNLFSYYLDIGLVLTYEVMSYGLAVTGICLFFRMKKSFRVNPIAEIPLSGKEKQSGMLNIGVVLFVLLNLAQILFSLG